MEFAEVGFLALRKLAALRFFDDSSLHRLVRQGRVRCFDRYKTVYCQGASAWSLFVLVDGVIHCRAVTDEGAGRRLTPTTIFGLETLAELAQPCPCAREEEAVASQQAICLVIKRDHIRAMVLHGTLQPEARIGLRKSLSGPLHSGRR